MENGKPYKVWYNDGERTRNKILVFSKEQHGLLEFINKKTSNKEEMPVSRIVRIEGMEDGTNNEFY